MRITLSPGLIQMISAKDAERQGQPLNEVAIYFCDGGQAQIYISEVDLLTLESCVGLYVMPY